MIAITQGEGETLAAIARAYTGTGPSRPCSDADALEIIIELDTLTEKQGDLVARVGQFVMLLDELTTAIWDEEGPGMLSFTAGLLGDFADRFAGVDAAGGEAARAVCRRLADECRTSLELMPEADLLAEG